MSFQAHKALYSVRSKASKVDTTVSIGQVQWCTRCSHTPHHHHHHHSMPLTVQGLQVRELLERRPLDFYMQPSRHAEPPRVHFCKYEELFVPEVQAYLWIKRKQVTLTNTHTRSTKSVTTAGVTADTNCTTSMQAIASPCSTLLLSHGAKCGQRTLLPAIPAPAHDTTPHVHGCISLARLFLSLHHRWRRIVRARRTMRDFIKRSQLEWDYWSKYIYFRHWKLFLTQTHFMHVPATEIQRIWKGIGPRRVGS